MRYLLGEIRSALTDGRPSVFAPAPPAAPQCRRDTSPADDRPDDPATTDRTWSPTPMSRGRSPAAAAAAAPLTLRPDVTFHFFCSHTPCGDASIFPKDVAAADDGGPVAKRRKTDDADAADVHRTGAKCLSDETRQDPRLPGAAYHAVGAVRTKPGRGDRTLSVSCSDKLLRWHWSGVQVSVVVIFFLYRNEMYILFFYFFI